MMNWSQQHSYLQNMPGKIKAVAATFEEQQGAGALAVACPRGDQKESGQSSNRAEEAHLWDL